jgi:hypothetical protein
MKTQGIVLEHQILDNKISEVYNQEIKDTDMTYLSTGLPGQPLAQHSQTRNPNMEEPFRQRP